MPLHSKHRMVSPHMKLIRGCFMQSDLFTNYWLVFCRKAFIFNTILPIDCDTQRGEPSISYEDKVFSFQYSVAFRLRIYSPGRVQVLVDEVIPVNSHHAYLLLPKLLESFCPWVDFAPSMQFKSLLDQ